jgi:hypothetical protein
MTDSPTARPYPVPSSPAELARLRAVFDSLDSDGNGVVDREEMLIASRRCHNIQSYLDTARQAAHRWLNFDKEIALVCADWDGRFTRDQNSTKLWQRWTPSVASGHPRKFFWGPRDILYSHLLFKLVPSPGPSRFEPAGWTPTATVRWISTSSASGGRRVITSTPNKRSQNSRACVYWSSAADGSFTVL